MSGVSCMNLTSCIEELDKYKRGVSTLSKAQLAEAYKVAIQAIEAELKRLEAQRKKIVSSGGKDEKLKESDRPVNPERISSMLDLYMERLYDFSSNGELGGMLNEDTEITSAGVIIDTFENLEKKINAQTESK